MFLKSKTINDVLTYIENNFTSGIDIDDITKFSGYSRRHIQDIIKQRINMPVGLYIRRIRISRSAALLRLTHMDIIDISVKLGFDSQQSFCREFKKLTGYTPREYRKNLNWDLTPLQEFLPRNEIIVNNIEKRTLPVGYVTGFHYNYGSPIPPLQESYQHRLNLIYEQLSSLKQDIWTLTSFNPHPNSTTRMKVKSIIGTKGDYSLNTYNCYECPSGEYACFSFRFNKDNYRFFSRHIYLKLMPERRLKRKNGYDIEVFYYSKDDFLNETISCDHYVPLEI